MISNKELRAKARDQLRGKWTGPVVVTLIYVVICVPVTNILYVGGGLGLICRDLCYSGFLNTF